MKIFFRYLFLRLLVPFAVCLAACTLIWIMAELYGNFEDFVGGKVGILVVLRYYLLQIPIMLVQVLPATLLFSTLWTLMALNRRCELVAFQSGGMAPIWLFSPFFVFAVIWMVVLAVDLNGMAARAEVTRERLMAQVKGDSAKSNVFENLPYVDKANSRVWYFKSLDINQGSAKGVEILQRNAQGDDMVKYFARKGEWTGEFWRLSGVLKISYGINGAMQSQTTYEELDLPDVTTPPSQLSLIVSQPDQLTVAQLSEYIATSTATEDHLAGYRTEWWTRMLYPLSLIVLMLFALLQGARTDRRGAAAGVIGAIVVLLLFIVSTNIFKAAGTMNKLPPFIAVAATQVIFGAVGLHLLAMSNGWWWQLRDLARRVWGMWSDNQASSGD